MSRQALLIFVKNPEAGKVKTRLAATIGNDAALSVYRQLIEHTAAITRSLVNDKIVFYSDCIMQGDIWDAQHSFKQLQIGKDLGERMCNAFATAFRQMYDKVVIIGTDCLELNEEIIMNAFTDLDKYDVVIGPAEDGGYYLLGTKKLHSQLFENIKWSTETVFDETIRKCAASGLSFYLLPLLRDIDDEKDLQAFKLQSK
jgi:rSAM/selenodomain-associated transferase 1